MSTAASTQDLPSQVDLVIRTLISENSPGLSVGVIRDGRLIFAQGFGLADLNARTLITPATNFRLASVTKQFTAMSVMLLVHDGKLRYDDALTKIFPQFPPYGRKITIRNLLNHTCGLKHYEEIYEQRMAKTPLDRVPQLRDSDALRILEEQDSGSFEPGARWEYSNSGYAVLAMIVERVSQQPFDEFLQHRIFAPLKMNSTIAYIKSKNEMPNRALGYHKATDGNSWRFSDQSPTSAVLGDGGVYSSIEDLAKWDRALVQNTLLSEKEMRVAFTPVQVEGGVRRWDGRRSEYGFGWFLDPYKGHPRMWHDGDTSGFHTTIQRLPDQKLTVIILANRTDIDAAKLATDVLDLYLAPRQ